MGGWSQRARDKRPPASQGERMGRPDRVEPMGIAGRAREQALLTELVTRAEDGRPGMVLVHGGSGVGKTRLAEAICSRAAEAGTQVLWGRCLRFGATSSS